MEKIKCLILFLFVVGCTPNDKTATDYYVLGNPLYDYDVEEKIKNLNIFYNKIIFFYKSILF